MYIYYTIYVNRCIYITLYFYLPNRVQSEYGYTRIIMYRMP